MEKSSIQFKYNPGRNVYFLVNENNSFSTQFPIGKQGKVNWVDLSVWDDGCKITYHINELGRSSFYEVEEKYVFANEKECKEYLKENIDRLISRR